MEVRFKDAKKWIRAMRKHGRENLEQEWAADTLPFIGFVASEPDDRYGKGATHFLITLSGLMADKGILRQMCTPELRIEFAKTLGVGAGGT